MPKIELIQGDCLEKMKDIPTASVDMVLTDPPYNTTKCKWDSIIPLEPMWEQLRRVIKPNGAIVMTASQPFTTTLIASNMKMFKYCWVWDKHLAVGHLVAKYRPMQRNEDVVVFGDGRINYYPQMVKRDKPRNVTKKIGQGNTVHLGHIQKTEYSKTCTHRHPTTIIDVSGAVRGGLHPTQKPVALMEYLIKTYTNEGETVLDFTCGSGTTGVACVNLRRNFIGIELDPEYFEIAKKRIKEV